MKNLVIIFLLFSPLFTFANNTIDFTYVEMLKADPLQDAGKIINVNDVYLIKVIEMNMHIIPGVTENQQSCWKGKVPVKKMWVSDSFDSAGAQVKYDLFKLNSLIETYVTQFNQIMVEKLNSSLDFKCEP